MTTTTLNGGAPVTTENLLDAAFAQAEAATAAGTYVVDIGKNITLTAALEAINLQQGVTLDIEGHGFTIDGSGTERGLFVYSGAVTVENLTLTDMAAVGGAGGAGSGGGGGGAGLGGGLFVADDTADGAAAPGNVTLTSVSFSIDAAIGGAGGLHQFQSFAGGGGGLGGAGGAGGYQIAGGGGGVGGAGGSGSAPAGRFGIIPAVIAGGASGYGYILGGVPPGGGGIDGGGGGAGFAGGGGGMRGGAPVSGGGDGGFGGGGGGGPFTGGIGGFGGGGAGGNVGGGGGFAGGGGFGGGGGGSGGEATSTSGAGGGGFGGGNGSSGGQAGGGGGGLGAGGDIFVQQGATLTIAGGSTLGGGSIAGGAGGSYAGTGQAYGDGIFIQGNHQSITFAPGDGQTETVSGVIADMTGSHDPSGQTGAGSIVMDGTGTLVLGADNDVVTDGIQTAGFTGGITIHSGTVELTAAGAAGSGAIAFDAGSTLDFDLTGSTTFGNALTGAGTLEVSGGVDLNVASAYAGMAQVDDASTLEFTDAYIGVASFSGSSTGPGGTLKFDAGSVGPITVVNPNDTVIAQPGSDDWIYSIVNYTLPANVDTLFLEGLATSGSGNNDAGGDALYATSPSVAATLTGNSANDAFVVCDSADVVVPKAGSHDVVYAAANYAVPAGVDALILEGAATRGVGNSDTAGDALYAANPNQAATLTGNSANDTFVVYNAFDVVVPKAGSHDVVYAAASYALPTGVDVLILEAGTQAVGNSDPAGDALYAANAGTTQTLIGNSANDTFVVYNSSDVVVPKAGSHDIVYSAVNYALPTGVDSLILEGSATQGVGNSDAAGDTLYAANQSQAATLTGNSHNDTFVVYNSADTVIGQAGSTDTVYTAANLTLPTNVDTLFLEGPSAALGKGNGDAVDALFGNASVASTLVAGAGADTLYVTGAAGTIMTGGAGHDTFAFPNVMGKDEVTNFGLSKDTLQFNATLFSNFTAAMSAASQIGANTVFTIDTNDNVTLDNVSKTSLTAGNFHFI